MPHGGLGSNVEIRMNAIPCCIDITIHHLEVHHGHGRYLPTIQTYVEGLKI